MWFQFQNEIKLAVALLLCTLWFWLVTRPSILLAIIYIIFVCLYCAAVF